MIKYFIIFKNNQHQNLLIFLKLSYLRKIKKKLDISQK